VSGMLNMLGRSVMYVEYAGQWSGVSCMLNKLVRSVMYVE
jgi:hypothetical protein